jgi:L-serine dehydratase
MKGFSQERTVNTTSIFNDVIGPVMRGPSSSHTAASFHIGTLARSLLGDEPALARIAFDPGGSFGQVYRQQGSDLGFAAGLMGWSITDDRFARALELAAAQGLSIAFAVEPLPSPDHPNTVQIRLASRRGRKLDLVAKSIGGGAVVFTEIDGWPIRLTGDAHDLLVVLDATASPAGADEAAAELTGQDGELLAPLARQTRGSQCLLHARRGSPLSSTARDSLAALPGFQRHWTAPPIFYVQRAEPLFASATGMVAWAERSGPGMAGERSLGQAALAYESTLLALPESEVMAEAIRRYRVMRAAVHSGLAENPPPMQLLRPSARQITQAEAAGDTYTGGLHTRAAARAMAVMHVNGGSGVVCAAPTAGAAGTLPAVLVTLAEERGVDEEEIALALLAASAVGLVVANRATFAAEVAGCQVEIGAAGAMAAAAVIEVAGGSARQACDAAAIAFQNTMGSVCDLVQGIVEIPCHTRNAVAASSAFVCADLILGGYVNSIPLDETVDAVYAVGKMLPCELKVTALGGLALAPSAQALPRLR